VFRLRRYERILIGNQDFEGGQFRSNFHVVGDGPRKPFWHRSEAYYDRTAWIATKCLPAVGYSVQHWNQPCHRQASKCFKTLSLTVITQRNFVADFLQVMCNFGKRPFCVFESPFGSLKSAFLRINWTFSLGVTVEALRADINWKSAFSLQRGQFSPKFQVEGVVTQQPFFLKWNEMKVQW